MVCPILAEQVKVVVPLVLGAERGGTEHLVEDVQGRTRQRHRA